MAAILAKPMTNSISANNDPSLPSALTQIFTALITEGGQAGDAAMEALGPALQGAIREGPEMFALRVLFPWHQRIGASVRSTYPDMDTTACSHLEFLYQHADFMEHHLERLFQRFEGFFACSDKTRWLMQRWQARILAGDDGPWPPDDRHYWHPQTQSLEFWLGVCDHLEHLYYGYSDAFLSDLQILVQAASGTEAP